MTASNSPLSRMKALIVWRADSERTSNRSEPAKGVRVPPNDLDVAQVQAGDHLSIAGDDLLGRSADIGRIAVMPDVVDPLDEDNVSDAGQGQDVPVEPSANIGAASIAHHLVAADAGVDHDEAARAGSLQPTVQDGRPVGLRAKRRAPALGD